MPGVTLYHAGPAPLGATPWSRIPPEYNLRTIGAALLGHGGWILGGLLPRDVTFECVDVEPESDVQGFAFGPGDQSDGDFFALAIEKSPSTGGEALCLYVCPDHMFDRPEDEFTEDERRRRNHARKIIAAFSGMHRTLAAPLAGITSPPPETSESMA